MISPVLLRTTVWYLNACGAWAINSVVRSKIANVESNFFMVVNFTFITLNKSDVFGVFPNRFSFLRIKLSEVVGLDVVKIGHCEINNTTNKCHGDKIWNIL